MIWKGFQKPKRLEVEQDTLTPTFGRFTAQPFERGFGTTIGNALRRILLSSVEGAAITAEYSALFSKAVGGGTGAAELGSGMSIEDRTIAGPEGAPEVPVRIFTPNGHSGTTAGIGVPARSSYQSLND